MDIIVPALVGVIQTTSERDHNSDSGMEGFDRLRRGTPWIEFRYYDEYTVDRFFRDVSEMRFSAIVFASNSLTHPSIFEASCAAREVIRAASNQGMGIVILHQFLPPGVVRDCTFLPLAHQVSFRGIADSTVQRVTVDRRALRVDSQRPITLNLGQFGDRSPVVWSEVRPLYEREWRSITTMRMGGRQVDAILRSRTPRARTIISMLPLDWLADPGLLAHAVSRAVRGRGTLYLHPAGEDSSMDACIQLAFGRAVLRGGHLSSQAISDPSEVRVNFVPYRHFSHLVISRSWTWSDLGSLLGQETKTRLENEGSITAHARDGGSQSVGEYQPLLVTVGGGRPAYLEIADRFARWFETVQERFRDGQTTLARALATVASTINEAVEDPDAAPQALALDQIRDLLSPYIDMRLRGMPHVDGHVLPTAAIASTMELLEFPAERVAPLRSWIEGRNYTSSTASLQQAKLWLQGLNVHDRLVPKTEIDRIYQALLAVRADGHDAASMDFLCEVLKDESQSISRRAIIAESLTNSDDPLVRARVADSARTLQNDLESSLVAGHPPLEAICLATAALIRIHATSGLTSGVNVRDESTGTWHDPDRDSELRRKLELTRQQKADAEAMVAKVQTFARRTVGISVTVAIATVLAAYSLLISSVKLDVATWVQITASGFVALAALVAYIGYRASRVGGEPRWMAALRDVVIARNGSSGSAN
ncbi:hypothetical protein [Micromonospora sp. LA-10]|uniref:hypothetical protein n=1 Tax=Micromonospora sp. LA-10 TaxID=3446364 RepID=UPI003F72E767